MTCSARPDKARKKSYESAGPINIPATPPDKMADTDLSSLGSAATASL